jgi:hypothetical protein
MKTRGWVSLVLSIGIAGMITVPSASQAQSVAGSPTIQTLAGRLGFQTGMSALDASLHNVVASSSDSAGNLLLAVSATGSTNQVLRISPAGIVTVIAGNGQMDPFPYNGPASGVDPLSITLPPLSAVQSLADGSVLIAGSKDLFRLPPTGNIVPLAMNPAPSASVPCPLAAPIYLSTMCDIDSLATDASGNVYVADRFWKRVYRISPTGTTTLMAGGGQTFTDGGPAVDARIFGLDGIATFGGSLYIGGVGSIRKVDPSGFISTIFSSSTPPPLAAGVAATEFGVGRLHGVLPSGDLLVQGPSGVLRFRTDGVVDRFAGAPNSIADPYAGGLARNANFSQPGPSLTHVTSVDGGGAAIVAVPYANELYRVGPDGLAVHIAGKRYQAVEPGNGLGFDTAKFISRTDDGSILLVQRGNSFYDRVWRYRGGQFTLLAGSLGIPRYQGVYVEGESAFRSINASSAIEGCNGNVYIDSTRIDAASVLHPLRPDTAFAAIVGPTLPGFRSMGGGCDGVFMLFGGFLTRVNANDTVSVIAQDSNNILGSDGAGGVFLLGSFPGEIRRRLANGTTSAVTYWGASIPSGWVRFDPDYGTSLRFHDLVGGVTAFTPPVEPAPLNAAPLDGRYSVVSTKIRLFAYGSKPDNTVAVVDRGFLRKVIPFGARDPARPGAPGASSVPRRAAPAASSGSPSSPRVAAPSAG